MVNNKFREVKEFQNIKELLYDSVKRYANHTAFQIKIKKDDKTTYKEISYNKLLEEVNALGTSFYKMGLKDSRVAVMGRNRYDWAVAHLANLLGGMVSVPLDKELQVEELENSLIRSQATALVFDEKYEEEVRKIKEQGKTKVKYFICMSSIEGYEYEGDLIEQGKHFIQQGENEYLEANIDGDKMGILLFTSGTTSKSKAVMLSQKGIAMNIHDMLCVETFYETDVNIAFLPFHHIFGSTCLLVMLAAGVKTVFTDGLRYISQNLKEYQVSVFVGVPVLIDKMYQTIEKEIKKQGKEKVLKIGTVISNFLLKFHIDIRRKLFKAVIDGLGGHMRFIISGGAPLDKKIAQKFNEFGIHLVQGYGLTETSPVIAAENDKCLKYGSVGIPMLNNQVEIVNQDEKGIGEIRVKGPNVMLGYYENEEATKEVLKEGWFYTGDLGYIDQEGYLFITGRRKDMIVLKNGKKVFPEELETLVNRLEEVEECFVFGMPEKEDKNDVKIAVKVVYSQEVVKEKYAQLPIEEVEKIVWNKIKEINKTLPKYKYMKEMIFTKEPLIKTTTNKVKRMEEMKVILEK